MGKLTVFRKMTAIFINCYITNVPNEKINEQLEMKYLLVLERL